VQGETAQQRAQRLLDQAIADVRALLADEDCAMWLAFGEVGAETQPLDPQTALNDFNAIVNARLHNLYNQRDPEPGHALTLAAAGPVGSGPNADLYIYEPFYAEDFDSGIFQQTPLRVTYNTYNHDYVYQLTPRQVRALTLLHEYRHAAGTLNGSHNGDPDSAASRAAAIVAGNEEIIERCLHARRDPNPTWVTAPPDPIELAPIDGIPTTIDPITPAPLPPPPPRDGEGDVTIGPLEGEPGYREPSPDAPVIDPSDAQPVVLPDNPVPPVPADPGPTEPGCPTGCLDPDDGYDDPYDPGYDYGGDDPYDYGGDDPYDYGGDDPYDDYDYGYGGGDPYDYGYGGGDPYDYGYDYGGGGGGYDDDDVFRIEEEYAY
jgi:hypothetical protein